MFMLFHLSCELLLWSFSALKARHNILKFTPALSRKHICRAFPRLWVNHIHISVHT